jgi:hypothetical protein
MTKNVEYSARRLWRPGKTRKPRSDSKLHGLAREQRAMVDKWLFDKGLTYQEVSEACLKMFGLQVSKSSVGRYHERELRGKVRRKREECRKGVSDWESGKADEEVGGWAREMCIGMLSGRGTPDMEEAYQMTLARMTKWALEEMQWPVEDERDVKGVLRVMRILISARQEKNEADMMKLAWRKFEMKAARECLHLMLKKKNVATDGTDFTEQAESASEGGKEGTREKRWPGRGERDPYMVWDFADGKIRRMPLLREQAGTQKC